MIINLPPRFFNILPVYSYDHIAWPYKAPSASLASKGWLIKSYNCALLTAACKVFKHCLLKNLLDMLHVKPQCTLKPNLPAIINLHRCECIVVLNFKIHLRENFENLWSIDSYARSSLSAGREPNFYSISWRQLMSSSTNPTQKCIMSVYIIQTWDLPTITPASTISQLPQKK